MPNLKLRYFDFNGGRGEAARLAMAIGNVAFEDERVPPKDWPELRDTTPFQALPTLEIDGKVITQSNAINRYVGKLSGLYPDGDLEALRCDEVMDIVEDVLCRIVATFGIEDAAELKAKRDALVAGPIRLYLERLQEILEAEGGEYFTDGRITVADLKVMVWIRQIRSGILDHVPAELVDQVAPKLIEHSERVLKHPGVIAYYDRV